MRLENSLSTTSGLETSRLTRRLALTSWSFAVVMSRSTQRRSSFARASVVVTRLCSSSEVHRLRISALRASVSRLKRRPLFWCRIQLRLAAQDRAHLFGLDESLLDQLLLDLVERLAPEVAQREQLLFPLLEQLSDGLDFVCLQAVERAHRQVELLDRCVHQPVLAGLLAAQVLLVPLDVVAELHEQVEVLREQLSRVADRLLGRHRAVRPDLDDQPVVIGRLADTGLLNDEVRLLHRGEDRVDRDHADGLALALVALSRDITLAPLDVQLHPQVALGGQRADVEVGVHDLDVRGGLDVRPAHLRRTLDVDQQRERVLSEALQAQLLESEG